MRLKCVVRYHTPIRLIIKGSGRAETPPEPVIPAPSRELPHRYELHGRSGSRGPTSPSNTNYKASAALVEQPPPRRALLQGVSSTRTKYHKAGSGSGNPKFRLRRLHKLNLSQSKVDRMPVTGAKQKTMFYHSVNTPSYAGCARLGRRERAEGTRRIPTMLY